MLQEQRAKRAQGSQLQTLVTVHTLTGQQPAVRLAFSNHYAGKLKYGCKCYRSGCCYKMAGISNGWPALVTAGVPRDVSTIIKRCYEGHSVGRSVRNIHWRHFARRHRTSRRFTAPYDVGSMASQADCNYAHIILNVSLNIFRVTSKRWQAQAPLSGVFQVE
jgi:hypothetical protein